MRHDLVLQRVFSTAATAAQLVLAAYEAGIDLALYPGSWSHWVTDPGRPVTTGAG